MNPVRNNDISNYDPSDKSGVSNGMNNQSNIERIVMRRVRTIRVLRVLFSNTVLAICAFSLSLWSIGREVWVARVIQNTPINPVDSLRFYIAAFDHTHFAVQLFSALALVSLMYLARETARAMSLMLIPARV